MLDDPILEPALRVLQELQAEFDRDHGLDFDRYSVLTDQSRTFTGLALAGEVGELANALKKAQRAMWRGEDPTPHLRLASEEIGDIFAYLLKLATLLRVDLAEVYLTTMSNNCF